MTSVSQPPTSSTLVQRTGKTRAPLPEHHQQGTEKDSTALRNPDCRVSALCAQSMTFCLTLKGCAMKHQCAMLKTSVTHKHDEWMMSHTNIEAFKEATGKINQRRVEQHTMEAVVLQPTCFHANGSRHRCRSSRWLHWSRPVLAPATSVFGLHAVKNEALDLHELSGCRVKRSPSPPPRRRCCVCCFLTFKQTSVGPSQRYQHNDSPQTDDAKAYAAEERSG